MKIGICGDTHFGAVYNLGKSNGNGGNTRVDDYKRTFNHIVDYAIENNLRAVIQTGDVFDNRKPSVECVNIVKEASERLSMANILSIFLMGNHDYCRTGDTFTSAISALNTKHLPNIRVVLEPEVIRLYDGDDGVNLLLMPFRDRRMYDGKTTEEDSLLYEAEVMELSKQFGNDLPSIAVGHNFFKENSYYDYGGTEVLIEPSAFGMCDMVVMGHYHTFKIVKRKSPIAIYSGSMEKLNFGDANVQKNFIEYDTTSKKCNILKCKTRELLDIELDLTKSKSMTVMDDFEGQLDDFDFKDKIVKVKVIIKDTMAPFFRKNLAEKAIYARQAFYLSKVIEEIVVERAVRDDSILKHTNDFDLFEAYVNGQSLECDILEPLLDLGKEIIA